MEERNIVQKKAKEVKLGDLVARSVGQVTAIKFMPVEQISSNISGRVDLFFGRIPVRMMSEEVVWVVKV